MRKLAALLARYSHVNWALADQAMVSGVNFLTGILLARYLGLEEFGRFSLAWMAVLFLNSVQYSVISSPMMSIGPTESEENEPAYYGAVLAQQVALSVVLSLLMFVGVRLSGLFFPQWQVQPLGAPLACAAFAVQMQDFIRRLFFTRGRAAAAFVNDALRYLGQLTVLMGLLLLAAPDSREVLFVIVGTATVATLVGIGTMGRTKLERCSLLEVSSRHWHFSKWVLVSTQVRQFTSYPLIWALGAFFGSGAVGVLVAARNIVGVLHIIYQGFDNFIRPKAAHHLKAEGVAGTARFIQRYMTVFVVPVGLICLSTALFPSQIAYVYYGDLLVGNEVSIVLFAVSYFVAFFSFPFTYFLLTLEETRPLAKVDGLVAFLSLALGVPVVYVFGLIGALTIVILLNIIRVSGLYVASLRTYKLHRPNARANA